MAEFIYQEPYPIQADKTEYRLLTKDYVKVVECDGRQILKVDPKGLELLAKEAYSDVFFYDLGIEHYRVRRSSSTLVKKCPINPMNNAVGMKVGIRF